MKNLECLSLKYGNQCLSVLDQQKLPHAEEWVTCETIEKTIDCIKQLKVRGAPLIGVTAAVALAQLSESGVSEKSFRKAAEELRHSRPTAVNLMACVDRMLSYEKYDPQWVTETAEAIFDEDVQLCDNIATNGAELINDGDRILTHCNTGGLATAGVGTALGVLRKAHDMGKKIHVYVDETRPLLQGGRLTTWELEQIGIPYTLICDNMAASLMSQGAIHKAIVGADRIATNGDFANKIGTFSVAMACEYHNLPFYVAAPYTTIDRECSSGKDVTIEQRQAFEVRGVAGSFGTVQWAPESANVSNPAFDVTPARLVSAWILDCGVYSIDDINSGVLKNH